jgi:LysR family transcriptional regulator, glycine cleavage system transcriptional activator
MQLPAAPPATQSLRTFLAVARAGSTSKAARIVHLTQSAVSKQVQTLEESLCVKLFEREPQGLRLTEAGAIYLPYAEAALEQLARGAQRLAERTDRPRPLRLHMPAIVAERWLMPLFPAFSAEHPQIDVQFTHYVSERDSEEPDIDIIHGAGPWHGREAAYLFGRDIALVASPGLLDRMGGFSGPADIQGMTLLQHFQMPSLWAEFTEAHGLRGAVPAHTIRYGYLSVVIRAAALGLGVALLPRCFVMPEIRSGELVNPLALGHRSASSYVMKQRQGANFAQSLQLLTNWLLDMALSFDRAATD